MASQKHRTGITPTREDDYAEWYQQVIKAADLAEHAPVRGCMVIKPWGYGIWEKIKKFLDRRIKETGHENAYFPLFIPLSFLEKEAEHVKGFAKECAIVTHHRLEEKEGRLIPAGELEEPLVVRPTSEAIIGDTFSRWVQSHRDLPLLINQWANVVRWEMRTRLFLRTSEFLWQEGHTVHETEGEAKEETLKMLGVYRELAENILALSPIVGEKTEGERFPGAEATHTFEIMMQDRKALQGGTSHYLGQNFAKAFNIQYSDRKGELQTPYTTSWGATTRLIGAVIMAHGDDDGLRLPPRIAPKQVVILPIIPKEEMRSQVISYAETIQKILQETMYCDEAIDVIVDSRDLRGGEKNWQWIKKGVPIRIEVGPRDVESQGVVLYRRDQNHREKTFLSLNELKEQLPQILDQIQKNYYEQSLSFRKKHTHTGINNFQELKAFFTPKNKEKPEAHAGWVLAKWCNDPKAEKLLDELKVTIRCLPEDQSGTEGICVVTGKTATVDAIFAKSY